MTITDEFKQLHSEAKAIVDTAMSENRGLTAEERASNDKRYARMDVLNRKITEAKQQATEAFTNGNHNDLSHIVDDASIIEPVHRQPRGQSFALLRKGQSFAQSINVSNSNHFGLGDYLRAIAVGPRNKAEQFALSTQNSAGGFNVPMHIGAQVVDALREQSVFFRAGALMADLKGHERFLGIPEDFSPEWVAENADADNAAFAARPIDFQPKTLRVTVPVSRELLEDAPNVNEVMTVAFVGAFAAKLDYSIGWGGGGVGIKGIVDTENILEVSTSGLHYLGLLDAVEELAVNKAEPTAVILSPGDARTVNGFVDSTGQPLRRPPALAEVPFITASQSPTDAYGVSEGILIGDFTKVWVGFRHGLRITTYVDGSNSKTNSVTFGAVLRADTHLVNPKAVCHYTGTMLEDDDD